MVRKKKEIKLETELKIIDSVEKIWVRQIIKHYEQDECEQSEKLAGYYKLMLTEMKKIRQEILKNQTTPYNFKIGMRKLRHFSEQALDYFKEAVHVNPENVSVDAGILTKQAEIHEKLEDIVEKYKGR